MPDLFRAHVVKKNKCRPGSYRFFKLGKVAHLDLNREVVGSPFPNPTKSPADAPGDPDMVGFYEDSIIKSEPVVLAPSNSYGVFLQVTDPGCCLPGIQQTGLMASEPVHIPAREGRDASKSLEQVERDPLSGEKNADLSPEHHDLLPRLDILTFVYCPLNLHPRIENLEYPLGEGPSRENEFFPGNDPGAGFRVGRKDELCSNIPPSEIFPEEGADQPINLYETRKFFQGIEFPLGFSVF